ncbi:hypothetical protein LN378_32165, partial [Enterobacter hormaechei subsp. steigerwaltii]|nr:hypothetical protein [Enterobacter hormaechei subsp. steigerwaltii]
MGRIHFPSASKRLDFTLPPEQNPNTVKKKTKKTDTPISAEPTAQAHKQTLSTIRHTIYNFLFQKE